MAMLVEGSKTDSKLPFGCEILSEMLIGAVFGVTLISPPTTFPVHHAFRSPRRPIPAQDLCLPRSMYHKQLSIHRSNINMRNLQSSF
jgi:hypothetical protein